MRVLLDTSTFLWLLAESRRLSATARDLIADEGNEVSLSTVSEWEIALKSRLGRLSLPEPVDRYLPRQCERLDLDILTLDEDAALCEARLPVLHKDPFDRMLVCQAVVHGYTILTPDPLIAQYAVRVAW